MNQKVNPITSVTAEAKIVIALGYNSFGEVFIMTNKIRECRKRKGLSQEELANKIGVKRAVVSKYETGKISPRIEIIQKISRVLGVPVHELVGDTMYKEAKYIRAVELNKNNFWRVVFEGEFGKTVFLTREAAERALKGEYDE